jgi:hypothetical protein
MQDSLAGMRVMWRSASGEGATPSGVLVHTNLHACQHKDEVQLRKLRIRRIVLLAATSQSYNVVACRLLQCRNYFTEAASLWLLSSSQEEVRTLSACVDRQRDG